MADLNIEEYRQPWENDKHWTMRKQFIQRYKDDFPRNTLLCLAQVYAHIELHNWSHPVCMAPSECTVTKNSVNEQMAEEQKEGIAELLVNVEQKALANPGSSSGTASQKRPSCEAFEMNSQQCDSASSKKMSAKKLKSSDSTVPSENSVRTSSNKRLENKDVDSSAPKEYFSSKNSCQKSISCAKETRQNSPPNFVQKSEVVSLESSYDQKLFPCDTVSKNLEGERRQNSTQAIIQKSGTGCVENSCDPKVLQFDILPKILNCETRQNSLQAITQKSDEMSLESSYSSKVLQFDMSTRCLKDQTGENFLQTVSQKSDTMCAENTIGQKVFQFGTVPEGLKTRTCHNSPQTVMCESDSIENSSSSELQFNSLPKSLKENFIDIVQLIENFVTKHLGASEILCKTSLKFNLILEYHSKVIPGKDIRVCFLQIDGVLISRGQGLTIDSACRDADRLAVDRLMWLSTEAVNVSSDFFTKLHTSTEEYTMCMENSNKKMFHFDTICESLKPRTRHNFSQTESQNSSETVRCELDNISVGNPSSSEEFKFDLLSKSIKDNINDISKFIQKCISKQLSASQILCEVSIKFNLIVEYHLKVSLGKKNVYLCFLKIDGVLISESRLSTRKDSCREAGRLAIERLMWLSTKPENVSSDFFSKSHSYSEILTKDRLIPGVADPCAVNTSGKVCNATSHDDMNIGVLRNSNNCDSSLVGNDSSQKDDDRDEVRQNSSDRTAQNLELVCSRNFCSMTSLAENLKSKFVLISEFLMRHVVKGFNPLTVLNNMSQKFKINVQFNYEINFSVKDSPVQCSLQINNLLVCKAGGKTEVKARWNVARLAIDKLMNCSRRKGNLKSRCFSNDAYEKEAVNYIETRQNSSARTAENLENFCSINSLPENLKSKFNGVSKFIMSSLTKRLSPVVILNNMGQKFKIQVKFLMKLLTLKKRSVWECSLQIDTVLIYEAKENTKSEACFNAAKLAIDDFVKFSRRVGNLNSQYFIKQDKCCKREKDAKMKLITAVTDPVPKDTTGNSNMRASAKEFVTSDLGRGISIFCSGNNPIVRETTGALYKNTSLPLKPVNFNCTVNQSVTSSAHQNSSVVPFPNTHNCSTKGNEFCFNTSKKTNKIVCGISDNGSSSKYVAILDYSDITKSDCFAEMFLKSTNFNNIHFNIRYLAIKSVTKPGAEEVRAQVIINKKVFSSGTGENKELAKEAAAKAAINVLKKTAYTVKVKHDDFVIDFNNPNLAFDNNDSSVPLPENNIGYRMLKTMGWSGGGLGRLDNKGTEEPIKAQGQGRVYHGLGYPEEARKKKVSEVKLTEIIEGYAKLSPISNLIFSPEFEGKTMAIKRLAEKHRLQHYYINVKDGERYIVVSRYSTADELVNSLIQDGGRTCKYELIPPTG